MTELFQAIRRESKRFKEKNDCAVASLAIATGVKYISVWAALQKQGRVHRRSTPIEFAFSALEDLGFNSEEVTRLYQGRTVLTLERELVVGRRGLVLVSGHLLAIRDGLVHDHSRGSRRRVVNVWHISKGGKYDFTS